MVPEAWSSNLKKKSDSFAKTLICIANTLNYNNFSSAV